MSVPNTFRMYQMLADKPRTFPQLMQETGLSRSSTRGALSALIAQGLVKPIAHASRGFVYGVETRA